MSAALLRRVAAIEQRQLDRLPQLPGLVVIGGDLEAQRAAFVATHGKPPEIEIVISRVCARRQPAQN